MELYPEGALTVGELKRALANVPDNVRVGASIFGLMGHVEKSLRVRYSSEHNILTLDADKHSGSFSDEEFSKDEFPVILEAEEA